MDFDELKEEIRRRLNLADIVGEHVRLERAGSRLKGLCPFHEEKTPSFHVDPQRDLYHCFGCGEGGDIFSFVMRREGLSFPEALRMLARRAGIPYEDDAHADERRRRRQILERANEIARDHFIDNLFNSPHAEHARNYVRSRGLNRKMVDRFQIGFALDSWDDLLTTLAQQGINATLAEEAGLAKRSDRGGHYDTFRNRIIFPICDLSGNPIAFGGRALDPENPAKYLNSPETPLFRKRRSIYAIHIARDAIVREKTALICEGYTDVIALHQAGLANAVAGMGTALTKEQLDVLARFAEELVLVYDADAAGARAALKNLEVFEDSDVSVSLVALPENMDPDEFVRTHGPDAFRELLKQRISPVEYELRAAFERHADAGPDGRARAVREAVDVLMKVSDWTARDEYLRRAVDFWAEGNSALGASVQRAIKLEFNRRARGERSRGPQRAARDSSFITDTLTRSGAGLLKMETELLAQALDDRALAERVTTELAPEDMILAADAEILRALADQIRDLGELDADRLIDGLPEEEGVRRRGVELTVTEVRPCWREDEQIREEQIHETICRLRLNRRFGGAQPLRRPTDGAPDEDETIESFRELERRVAEGIDSGELTFDDPLVQKYREIARRIRGSGGGTYFGDTGQEQTPPQAPLLRAEQAGSAGSGSTSAREEADSASDAEPPPDDRWAVEEGDPFSTDG